MVAVALSCRLCLFQSCGQPEHTAQQHDERCNDTKNRRRKGIGTEVSHRNRVLNLRCARNRGHGEGKCTERDSRRKQSLRDICFSEQRRTDRIDGESRYEKGNAAVGDDRTGNHNSPKLFAASCLGDNRFCDGFCTARKVHHLTEYRAEQENREIRLDIGCQIRHIGFRINRHHVEISTLKDYEYGRDQRQNRRNQDHGPAFVGQQDQ